MELDAPDEPHIQGWLSDGSRPFYILHGSFALVVAGLYAPVGAYIYISPARVKTVFSWRCINIFTQTVSDNNYIIYYIIPDQMCALAKNSGL